MYFSLENTQGFSLERIKEQFAPFDTPCDKLPPCRIRFTEKPKDILKKMNMLSKVGDHRFYLAEDFIAVANATSFVLVKNNFTDLEVLLSVGGKYPETQVAFLMLQGYRYVLAHHGQFQMHGAAVEHNGCGVVFCGLPGAGKSTQAHLWEEHLGARALNLDQPCIFFEDESVHISGSPWSGKESCYKNRQVPLKAVFFVEKAKENRVVRLGAGEAFSLLYLNNYLVPVNEEIEKKHTDAVERLVSRVPVYRLECTISGQAVALAHKAVFPDE